MSSIKSWPDSERPRERLLEQGPSQLSTSELLAILIRTGTHGKSAVSLARDLIKKFDGLRGLFSAGHEDISSVKGLGPAKAAQLLASMELGKRYLEENIKDKSYVHKPQAVYDLLMHEMRDLDKEILKVIYLDQGGAVLDIETLFEGTIDQSKIYPRELVKKVLAKKANAIIMVHNHPSGQIEPSTADLAMTKEMKKILETIDVHLIDHIIIGDNCYLSMKNKAIL